MRKCRLCSGFKLFLLQTLTLCTVWTVFSYPSTIRIPTLCLCFQFFNSQYLFHSVIPIDAPGNIDPSLVEKQKQLKRARIADAISDHLCQRPGPLELVRANILHTTEPLEKAVKGKFCYLSFLQSARTLPFFGAVRVYTRAYVLYLVDADRVCCCPQRGS